MALRKVDYLNSLRCAKLAWTQKNRPALLSAIPTAASGRMLEWRCVEGLARRLYPNGVMVADKEFGEAASQTLNLIGQRRPIFEAAFEAAGCRMRADVLVPHENGTWQIVEVKSSTRVKADHIHDVAYQIFTLQSAGLGVSNCQLAHINNEYEKDGAIDPERIIEFEDVTEEVLEAVAGLSAAIRAATKTVETTTCPTAHIGTHCVENGNCPMMPVCWRELPENSVIELAGAKKRALRMLEEWPRIVDVPCEELNPKQQVQQATLLSGKSHFDAAPVRAWLEGLEYPIYNLDFETINPAVPVWDGTRPYQQIPFQFAIAVVEEPQAPTEFIEFLADGTGDPRPALVEALGAIGPAGTVLAYNATFEKQVLTSLANAFPKASHLRPIADRLGDLATPFREFWLYHPDQRGQYSIKSVLPAWTEYGYKDLTICIGTAASLAFLQIAHKTLSPTMERIKRKALIEYCRRDVVGMVLLLKKLTEVASEGREPRSRTRNERGVPDASQSM